MTAPSECHVELHLPNRPEFIVVACSTAFALTSRLGFDMEAMYDIRSAVGEACNNALEHGCSAKAGTEMITMRCEITDESLIIIVQDCGTGTAQKKSLPKQAETTEQLDERGFGKLLINSLMDEVTFNSIPDHGTQVRMVKHRHPVEER